MAPVSNIEDTFNLKMNPKPPNLHLLHSVDIFPTTTYDHHLRGREVIVCWKGASDPEQ